MQPEELLELMKHRRSIRSYTDDAVSDENIKMILEAGRWCQSASNVQPWKFIVIKDPDILEKISKCATYGKFIKAANIAIAVIADKVNAPKWYIHDTSMASHQMCLMISALGLGTCWIGSMQRDKVAKILGLNKRKEFVTTILPVGHPLSHPEPTQRKELEDITSYVE